MEKIALRRAFLHIGSDFSEVLRECAHSQRKRNMASYLGHVMLPIWLKRLAALLGSTHQN